MRSTEIRVKLIVLVAIALAMVVALGWFAWFQAAKGYQNLVDEQQRQEKILTVVSSAQRAELHLKMQVQEWKDLLLRGQDQASYEKYLGNFIEQDKLVAETLRELRSAAVELGIADELQIDDLITTFSKLKPTYLAALNPSGRRDTFATNQIDKEVVGIDRQPHHAGAYQPV